ncbi:MAG: MarR family transcriptional regulator [Alphaproteobacteria bacterium]|nr:MarR family transcriptional regulator [Alphaproteobacteria bacterium]
MLFTFFNEIGIIDQLARARLDRGLPDELRASHFIVLNHLVRMGDGKSPVALARAFQVTKGAITNTLQRLEARGLIALSADPDDGRGKRVTLTAAGRRMRDQSILQLWPAFADLAPVATAAEIEAVLPLLRRIREHLDRARDRDPA